ncbi:MAG TPA: pantoate--beta-alanine ligase [Flavobacterium sp.]|nr:pantoate--beta-alanine ligase [Flavobacterium sp.]
MLVFDKKFLLINYLLPFLNSNTSIGFVPTMGALHHGHLALLKKSMKNNTINVVSIFVNPTQFNNSTDLELYPRNLNQDLDKIATVCPDCIVFTPSIDDIYEGKTYSQPFDFDGLELEMEGKHRLGHFDGVGTVVKKLFEIVNPTRAYFGEKDFQQLQIVRKLVEKNNLPVSIIGCPIYREKSGLAMSSRNERLSETERNYASVIFKTLETVKVKFTTKSAQYITKWVINSFKKNKTITLEYFEIADENTLRPTKRKSKNKKYRAFIAVFINNIRLIDNISLN